jgi:hypothetical protein
VSLRRRDVSRWPKAVRLVCSTSDTATPFPRGVGIWTLRPTDAAEGLYFIYVREENGYGENVPSDGTGAAGPRYGRWIRTRPPLPLTFSSSSAFNSRISLLSLVLLGRSPWRTIPPTRGHFVAEFEPAAVTNLTLSRVKIPARPLCAGCHHRAQTIAPAPIIPGRGPFLRFRAVPAASRRTPTVRSLGRSRTSRTGGHL